MLIRRAKHIDIDGINVLLNQYAMQTIDPSYVNKHDFALVAEDKGRIVGFLFVGRMANGTKGYIDHFVVDRDYHRKGVGERLAKKMIKISAMKGLKEAIGFIAFDEFHDASAMNALKSAMSSPNLNFRMVRANVDTVKQELGI